MRNSTPERPNDELQFLGSNAKVSGLKPECSTSRSMGKGKVSEDGTKKPDGSTFMCEICSDEKQRIEVFRIMGCNHSYCSDCASKYVAAKLQDSTFRICCPVSGCGGVIEPENCRFILPKTVFDRWGDALCEAMILSLEKFYCPYKDCSALLIDENLEIKVEVAECECPECRRLFCAKCKVPWHSEISCSEFQKLNKNERQREDIQLMNFAAGRQWKRCPNCGIYVERVSGCGFMVCRCRCNFCYTCGAATPKDHFCRNCGQITG
ncbi:probable E3 ubiquitin-protein ligase RNF217 [Ipomoea triloba]|uniref:probable E3 ubiquitin-protein ligase RNF217 n=1 Tax=Ipomoea triloba TaxID=35885 RepID=UPI00125E8089|nr:probable E3 ubiquitin-protein ligase RNF217 [Ipomoea triloba]